MCESLNTSSLAHTKQLYILARNKEETSPVIKLRFCKHGKTALRTHFLPLKCPSLLKFSHVSPLA